MKHHVYSSLRGYRTLFCSPDLPEETRDLLDSLAARCRSAAARGPVRGLFGLGGGLTCALRGFEHGVDHVGRTRVCIHSVVVYDRDLARIPFFTPTSMPSELFVNEAMELQYVSQQLPSAWRIEDPPEGECVRRIRSLPDFDKVLLLLPLFFTRGRTTYVIDGQESERLLEAISVLLPPSYRRTLTYLRAGRRPVDDPPATCEFYFVDGISEDMENDPEVALVDLKRGITWNLQPVGRYARFIFNCLREKEDESFIVALCSLMERYCGTVGFDEYRLVQFAEAFRKIREIVDDEGRVRPDRSPRVALRAVGGFCQAGCVRLCADLMRGAAQAMAPWNKDLQLRIDGLEEEPLEQHDLEDAVRKIVDVLDYQHEEDTLHDTDFLDKSENP